MGTLPREDSDTCELMKLYVEETFACQTNGRRPINAYEEKLVRIATRWLLGERVNSSKWLKPANELDWRATALLVVIAYVFDAHAADLNESTRTRRKELWELIQDTPAWKNGTYFRVGTIS
jgi:hypothetical protein